MRVLGNILWIILGGLAIAIGWALVGLILCISIIGIPFGIQAFKMAVLTLTPFGKTVQYGGGVGSALANILWVVLVGCWMALGYLGAGVLNCITIIGIPFGIQSFKMAKLALWPFGAQIYSLLITRNHIPTKPKIVAVPTSSRWYSNYGNISPYRKKSSISASLCNISVSETPMNLAKSTDAAKRSCIFKSRLNA